MNNIILVQNLYRNRYRDHEFLFCLEQNLKNKFIDKYFIFSPQNDIDFYYKKIKDYNSAIFPYEDRFNYKTIFQEINGYNGNDIYVLANSDIFFDNTLEKIKSIDFTETVLAITRWEFDGDKHSKYIGWDYSQDVWIFKKPLNMLNTDFNFEMGKPGCDNRLAYELSKNYTVINPCKDIRCHHYHLSNYRNYTPGDKTETIPEPYLRIEPSNL